MWISELLQLKNFPASPTCPTDKLKLGRAQYVEIIEKSDLSDLPDTKNMKSTAKSNNSSPMFHSITAEEIKNCVTLEQALSRIYGLEVKKRMPCPIHGGAHNNFSVQKDFFKCFSCGVSGDIFTLVQALSNINFIQAKELIADYFNLKSIQSHQDKNDYKKRLKELKQKQEAKYTLKRLRQYQQNRICQVLREVRTLDGNSYLEKHLEGLIKRFEERADFFIAHDIHAHLSAVLYRYIASKNDK